MKKNDIIIGNEQYVDTANFVRENNITNEINMIKEQAAQFLIMSSIEIGRRLTEAKSMIKHGQWENWLKERVQFSQRTANNHMKIYKEYGENGLASNSQLIANLRYTQAVALLSVPTEKREKFVEENNVKDMKIAELNAKIEELKNENTDFSSKLLEYEKEYEEYQEEEEKNAKEMDSLKAHIERLEEDLKKAENDKQEDIKKQLKIAIKAEQQKLIDLEEDNNELRKQLEEIKERNEKERASIQKAEQVKAEREFKKKEKELQKITSSLEKQLNEAIEETKKAKISIECEKNKNKEIADITKCNMLIEDIIVKYNEVLTILKKYEEINSKSANEIQKNLNRIFEISERKNTLKAVS